MKTTYEVDQPWVVYTYLTTDRRTRITGRSRMRCRCAICGDSTVLSLPIPRFGPVPAPEGGKHPARVRYLAEHAHPGQTSPRDWAQPLLNPAAWPGGLPLDVFENVARTARMEAEMDDPRGDDHSSP